MRVDTKYDISERSSLFVIKYLLSLLRMSIILSHPKSDCYTYLKASSAGESLNSSSKMAPMRRTFGRDVVGRQKFEIISNKRALDELWRLRVILRL